MIIIHRPYGYISWSSWDLIITIVEFTDSSVLCIATTLKVLAVLNKKQKETIVKFFAEAGVINVKTGGDYCQIFQVSDTMKIRFVCTLIWFCK